MRLVWTAEAWEDYLYWQQADPAVLKKVNALIKDAIRNPFSGLGKPEPLKGSLQGWWSRRVTGEQRLVYRVVRTGDDRQMQIVQCRYHY